MIRASRMESLWYDDLSILTLKCNKGSETARREYDRLTGEIVTQVGATSHVRVMQSQEYADLITTNRRLFDLIDFMKSPERPADRCYDKEVDQLNLARNKAKAALQARWFPDSPFTEVKLGYKDAPISS